MSNPKVSVLMPVFNGGNYLKASIESILSQDFPDFEFLIVNDGSTDNTAQIISSYPDRRIRTINNGHNLGLVSSLNTGIDNARGKYIVRMDSDDISFKKRLSVQVQFMDKNSKIGASGSYYHILYKNSRFICDFPLTHSEIRPYLLFNSPIPHPTAIIRKSILDEFHLQYSTESKHLEDYDLWSRIATYSELANIKQSLLNYRVHEGQISTDPQNVKERYKNISTIRTRHLKELDLQPSQEELTVHNLLSDAGKPDKEEMLKDAEQWLSNIRKANQEKKLLNETYLDKIILERWMRFCFNFRSGTKKMNSILQSELFSSISLTNKRKLELLQQLFYAWKRRKIK